MPLNQFSVKFGRVARTLEYADAQGQLVFTFNFGSGEAKSLALEHYSPQTQQVSRYRLAFERTKQFLESGGYGVEVHGDFAVPQTMTASDVTALIQAELASHMLPDTFPFASRSCLLTPTRSEFRLHHGSAVWDLWLVFEEPVHKLRIVFDEHSKQFGVAERNIFHGFHGSFIQTVDAISKVA